MSDSIRVVCRLRPLNKIEIANNGEECVLFTNKDLAITIGGDQNKYNFTFDTVFGPNTHQVQIYREVALPVVKSVVAGFNGTIFAYGQTGGGKTWTMEGPNHHDHEFKGLIPRTIEGLFEAIQQSDQNLEFVIKCSYIEIYNEKLFDLLDPSKARLQIKEDKIKGVFIQNCTEISVASHQQMLKTMNNGSQNRRVAFTGMNQNSSRSHSLFIIYVNQKNIKKDSTKQSKLYFVDLAGSEKVGKTGVMGQQLEEAKNINKSLSALGNVINALTSDKKEHIPYRDSKLTRILQESLGGNSKTTLIINCSMCTYNDKQTLSTLRFGYRAKSIKNKAKINQEKSAKELLILLDHANKTIAELKAQMTGTKIAISKEQKQEKIIENGQVENSPLIQELRSKIEELQGEQQEKNKQIKEMQVRLKSILLDYSQLKEQSDAFHDAVQLIHKTLKGSLHNVNKYMNRVYLDLEYWFNNFFNQNIDSNSDSHQIGQIKSTIENIFTAIMHFTSYYQNTAKQFIGTVESQEKEEDNPFESLPGAKKERDTNRMRIVYSEPNLLDHAKPQQTHQTADDLQMSCIVEMKQMEENHTISNSDKLSQEQSSFTTEFETLLQSFETKESQKQVFEELSISLKNLKRQNEELTLIHQKMNIEAKLLEEKIQEKYSQQIIDLEERVEEYKIIIKRKDIELTSLLDKLEQEKMHRRNEKLISQQLKKVIESNGNLKSYYEMEQKLKSLGSERQKIFNELYQLRNQLDESEMNCKEKDQHIESLKEVMKELTHSNPNSEIASQETPSKQIQKLYNQKVYGTEAHNVVVSVKGGGKNSFDQIKKLSSARKKVSNIVSKKEEKSNFLPFIKGFFG